jgi:hypothetical membrane protein
MRIIGRITGIIGILIFLIFLLIALLGKYPAGRGTFDIAFISIILVSSLFSYVISWRRVELAGAILTTVFLLMTIASMIVYGFRDSLNWMQAGLPIILTGLLFILSSWFSNTIRLLKYPFVRKPGAN